jgi:hypothetical protein
LVIGETTWQLKKTKAEWPFPAGEVPKSAKAKKPTKKELEAQKLAEQEKLILH